MSEALLYIDMAVTLLGGIENLLKHARNKISMAIRRCVNCGTPLPDNETYCTRCGFENGK